jgi:hypothetical protein
MLIILDIEEWKLHKIIKQKGIATSTLKGKNNLRARVHGASQPQIL